MLPLPLSMELELTSPNEPAAARLQPHARIDEIKEETVFDVKGGKERQATVATEILNYNSGTKKKNMGGASKTLIN